MRDIDDLHCRIHACAARNGISDEGLRRAVLEHRHARLRGDLRAVIVNMEEAVSGFCRAVNQFQHAIRANRPPNTPKTRGTSITKGKDL